MEEKQKSIYIMISQTHTNFAKVVRRFGNTRYNHAAISFDAEMKEIYAFARPQHNAVLNAHLVNENLYRYTLGKAECVNVVIFKIDISKEEYDRIKALVYNIKNDKDYIYNLLSVLSFPVFRGFSTYKAFSCIEFVMYILKEININIPKKLSKYKPDHLLELLKEYKWYEGDLLKISYDNTNDETYFAPLTMEIIKNSAITMMLLAKRLVFNRNWNYK